MCHEEVTEYTLKEDEEKIGSRRRKMSKKGFFARRVTAMACTAALLASSIPLSWVQAIAYDNNPVKSPSF